MPYLFPINVVMTKVLLNTMQRAENLMALIWPLLYIQYYPRSNDKVNQNVIYDLHVYMFHINSNHTINH